MPCKRRADSSASGEGASGSGEEESAATTQREGDGSSEKAEGDEEVADGADEDDGEEEIDALCDGERGAEAVAPAPGVGRRASIRLESTGSFRPALHSLNSVPSWIKKLLSP